MVARNGALRTRNASFLLMNVFKFCSAYLKKNLVQEEEEGWPLVLA